MANNKSAIKRVRQTSKRKTENRYFARTMRSALKKIRNTTSREEAMALLPKFTGLLDRLAKKRIIHQNKAANLKSSVAKHVNNLA